MLKTRNSFDISLLTKVDQFFRENDLNRTEHSSGFYLQCVSPIGAFFATSNVRFM